jgi:hypothetical protein
MRVYKGIGLVVALGLAVVGCIRAATQPVDYLPLSVGNRWQLSSPATVTPMVYEVTGQAGATFLVRWDNPWVKKTVYGFRPSGQQVMLASLDMGKGVMALPDGVVYFDFDVPEQAKWDNLLGEFSVVERRAKVETPSGTYQECIHLRYQTKDKKSVSDYLLAPGVGFVQFGSGPAAYKLSSFRKGNAANRPAPVR